MNKFCMCIESKISAFTMWYEKCAHMFQPTLAHAQGEIFIGRGSDTITLLECYLIFFQS